MGLLARQRAIEFGEEATGLLRVSVEVGPQRRVELGPSLVLDVVWLAQAAVGRAAGPLAVCAFQGTR
jgi:hypothetical protein